MRYLPGSLDRLALFLLVVFFVIVPPFLGDYWLKGILVPMLILSIAALGLNVLTGYAGLISLGQAAFMAIGAFAGVIAYGRYGIPIPLTLLIAGGTAALVGAVVGTPSPAHQGPVPSGRHAGRPVHHRSWTIQRVPWIGAGSMVTIDTPPVFIGAWEIDTALEQYYFSLGGRRDSDALRLEPDAEPHRTGLDGPSAITTWRRR